MNTPPPPPKKKTENKKNNKTARLNHTCATKKVHEEKHEHKDTTWKNTITKANCHKTSKKPLFSLFFGHPGRVGKILRIIFWRRTQPKTKKKKNGPKNENPKIGKRYFSPSFWWLPKQELISGRGGGAFFWYSSVEDEFYWPPFLGVQFPRPMYANDIILQK